LISITLWPLQTDIAPAYKILAKLTNLWWSYSCFKVENLGADPTYHFMVDGFQSLHDLCRPVVHTYMKSEQN